MFFTGEILMTIITHYIIIIIISWLIISDLLHNREIFWQAGDQHQLLHLWFVWENFTM